MLGTCLALLSWWVLKVPGATACPELRVLLWFQWKQEVRPVSSFLSSSALEGLAILSWVLGAEGHCPG